MSEEQKKQTPELSKEELDAKVMDDQKQREKDIKEHKKQLREQAQNRRG